MLVLLTKQCVLALGYPANRAGAGDTHHGKTRLGCDLTTRLKWEALHLTWHGHSLDFFSYSKQIQKTNARCKGQKEKEKEEEKGEEYL